MKLQIGDLLYDGRSRIGLITEIAPKSTLPYGVTWYSQLGFETLRFYSFIELHQALKNIRTLREQLHETTNR